MEETLLPSQLVGSTAGAFLPERRLAAAVLGVALADYQEFAAVRDVWGRLRFAEVEHWFMSNTPTGWEFSFVNVCAILNLDVSAIRAGVRACRGRPVPVMFGPGVFNRD